MKVPTWVMITGYYIAALFLAMATAAPVLAKLGVRNGRLRRARTTRLQLAGGRVFRARLMMVQALRNRSVEALSAAFTVAPTVLALPVPAFGANWGAWDRSTLRPAKRS